MTKLAEEIIMALISRISRLFRADFNAVLDRIEEPDVLLKQALREMEEDIHSDVQQLKFLEKESVQLEYKINEIEKSIEQVNQELDICFESNEAELARSQVKRKLEIQRYEKHLRSKLNSKNTKISNFQIRIEENKSRLTVMQQKLELLIEDEPQFDGGKSFSNISEAINDDDVDMAFLREKLARSAS